MSTERFCPICGRTGVKLIENLCEYCYRERHPLAEVISSEVRVPVCRECLSYVYRGRWVRPRSLDPENFVREVTERYLDKVLRFHGEVKEVRLSFTNLELLTLEDLSQALSH